MIMGDLSFWQLGKNHLVSLEKKIYFKKSTHNNSYNLNCCSCSVFPKWTTELCWLLARFFACSSFKSISACTKKFLWYIVFITNEPPHSSLTPTERCLRFVLEDGSLELRPVGFLLVFQMEQLHNRRKKKRLHKIGLGNFLPLNTDLNTNTFKNLYW